MVKKNARTRGEAHKQTKKTECAEDPARGEKLSLDGKNNPGMVFSWALPPKKFLAMKCETASAKK